MIKTETFFFFKLSPYEISRLGTRSEAFLCADGLRRLDSTNYLKLFIALVEGTHNPQSRLYGVINRWRGSANVHSSSCAFLTTRDFEGDTCAYAGVFGF